MNFRLIICFAIIAGCSEPQAPDPIDMSVAADLPKDLPPAPDLGDRDATVDLGRADVSVDAGSPPTDVPFDEAAFAATHNSYSGRTRGTILEQLEGGARFIEFDVHADDFAANGYEIGHDDVGHEVASGDGNPDDFALSSWLAVVQDWRAQNPQHVPLTIGIDVKDSLANRSYADGNMARLNAFVEETFGDALFREADIADGWPTVDAMRGRVLVVLSGDTTTRLAYRQTAGSQPAIATNATGQLIVAHSKGTESRLWTGAAGEPRRYEPTTGTDPAVALADDGTVVWLSVVNDVLQVRTGVLGAADALTWDGDAVAFADTEPATNPSVRWLDATSIREVHETPAGELRTWDGAWDASSRTVVWTLVSSADPRFDETSDGGLTVTSEPTPPYPADVVFLDDGTTRRRLRLPQAMWSESQVGGPAEFEDDGVYFFAADAFGVRDVAWAQEKRAAGGIVRLWKFNLPNVQPDPPVTYPATDQPRIDWYLNYCGMIGCLAE